MRRTTTVTLTSLAALVAAAAPSMAMDAVPSAQVESHSHALGPVQAAAVPGSRARGSARVMALPSGKLQVTVVADGLTPGVHHMMHLHTFPTAPDQGCPGPVADADGDGLVSVTEGVPWYGPVMVSLTTSGATTGTVDMMAFPLADATGHLEYQRTFAASEANLELARRVQVVVHGLDLDASGTLAGGMETTIPVLCGGVAD